MLARFRSLLRHRLFSGVAVLAVTQFGASLAGLLKTNVLNSVFFGQQSYVTDAYLAAFRPSDLLFQTCVISAMGTVLVPVLARYRAHDKHADVEKVLAGTIGMTALLFGAIALVLAVIFPWIVPLLGVRFEGETLALYIQFARLALLSNFLFVFGNAYGQYLVTIEKYWIYGITPILYTLGTVFGTLVLTPHFGPLGPMVGTLLGAVVYVIVRVTAVARSGCRIRMSLWHPDLAEMGKLMVPRVLALGAFQIQLLYLDGFATRLPKGFLTINSNARDFQSVIVGVVGIAVAQAIYSSVSQSAAKKNAPLFRKYIRTGTLLTLGLTIPGALLLALLTPVEARLVHLLSVLPVFAGCVSIYAVSIPFESLTHIQYRAFYALKETMIPAVVGVLGGLVAIGVGWMFLERWGIYALPAGFTAGEIVQVIGLAAFLPWKERRWFGAHHANV